MAEHPLRTFQKCARSPYNNCPSCCSLGFRYEWPELIGKNAQQAQAIIENDNPIVAVVISDNGRATIDMAFCCNRVFLILDNNGNVSVVPRIG